MNDPYKKAEHRHKVTAYISEEDWQLLFGRVAPRFGMQQKVLSTLLYHFIEQLKKEIRHGRLDPTIPLAENVGKLESLLRRYAVE